MPLFAPGEPQLLQERTESGSGRSGVLTLTSLRVIFEAPRKQGLVTQLVRGDQLATLLDPQLAALTNVHRDKPLIGRASLRVEAAGKSHIFKVRDADQWVGAITRAHQSAPRAEAPAAPVNVYVQGPAAPAPQSFLHCRHCGSLIPAGAPGAAMRCPSCGAAL